MPMPLQPKANAMKPVRPESPHQQPHRAAEARQRQQRPLGADVSRRWLRPRRGRSTKSALSTTLFGARTARRSEPGALPRHATCGAAMETGRAGCGWNNLVDRLKCYRCGKAAIGHTIISGRHSPPRRTIEFKEMPTTPFAAAAPQPMQPPLPELAAVPASLVLSIAAANEEAVPPTPTIPQADRVALVLHMSFPASNENPGMTAAEQVLSESVHRIVDVVFPLWKRRRMEPPAAAAPQTQMYASGVEAQETVTNVAVAQSTAAQLAAIVDAVAVMTLVQ